MKKSGILGYLAHLIVLIMICTVYLVGGGINQPNTSWISFFCILFSYVMVIITPMLTQRGKDRATYLTSMYTITGVYFAVELILGCLIIFKGIGGIRFAILSQLILAGVSLLLLFGNMAADEHTAHTVKRQESEVAYIKEATISLKAILSEVDDKQLYRKVERVYEVVQASPTKSSSSVYAVETEILEEISCLKRTIRSGDIQTAVSVADKVIRLVNERNRVLQSNQ